MLLVDLDADVIVTVEGSRNRGTLDLSPGLTECKCFRSFYCLH